jgi:hypothetical protein
MRPGRESTCWVWRSPDKTKNCKGQYHSLDGKQASENSTGDLGGPGGPHRWGIGFDFVTWIAVEQWTVDLIFRHRGVCEGGEVRVRTLNRTVYFSGVRPPTQLACTRLFLFFRLSMRISVSAI